MTEKGKMLNVGIVGVGGISSAHISAWEAMEDVSLTALCDIRSQCLEKYPQKHLYTDFGEMLEKESLDILDICLPTFLHAEYALMAMERHIHVICEKPVSLNPEDADRVYSSARKNNVCFMVAQVLRFWPEYQLVKKLYDSGEYGSLLSGSMTRLGTIPKWSWENWMLDESRSGLVPFDLHIHDLDFMVYAFGVPANRQVHRCRRPEQDYLHAVYEYPGFFITAESSWYAAPYPFSAGFRFHFEKALLACEAGQCILYQNNGEILNLTGESDCDTGNINLPKSDAYANEIRYFTDCVLEGRFPDRVKPEELKSVIHILKTF